MILSIEQLVVRLMHRIFAHSVQYPLSPFSRQAESTRE